MKHRGVAHDVLKTTVHVCLKLITANYNNADGRILYGTRRRMCSCSKPKALSRLDYGNAVLMASRLLNAAARLIYHMRSADHITDALASLHSLHIPKRIDYTKSPYRHTKFFTEVHRDTWVHSLIPAADFPGHQTLRFAGTNRLLVPPVRLSTVGNRAFTVAELCRRT